MAAEPRLTPLVWCAIGIVAGSLMFYSELSDGEGLLNAGKRAMLLVLIGFGVGFWKAFNDPLHVLLKWTAVGLIIGVVMLFSSISEGTGFMASVGQTLVCIVIFAGIGLWRAQAQSRGERRGDPSEIEEGARVSKQDQIEQLQRELDACTWAANDAEARGQNSYAATMKGRAARLESKLRALGA